MNYTLIDNSADLEKYIAAWNVLDRIAVDFECEFNLHIYGEHLCLIQIFDGTDYYIIDPRSGRLGSDTLCAFFTSPVRKVWFDCQSDNALVYKKYGVSISNIVDIRVYALTLGFSSFPLRSRTLSLHQRSVFSRQTGSNGRCLKNRFLMLFPMSPIFSHLKMCLRREWLKPV